MAFAILDPPVIRDLESQNTSVPFAVIVVEGFPKKLKSTLAVDKFMTAKPPWAPPVMLACQCRVRQGALYDIASLICHNAPLDRQEEDTPSLLPVVKRRSCEKKPSAENKIYEICRSL